MSKINFLITETALSGNQKYFYKDIIKNIEPDDMFYGGQISFHEKLSDAEDEAIKNVFQQLHVYAIHSDFGLTYRTDFSKVISSTFAENSFAELIWFRKIIEKILCNNVSVYVLSLRLGAENNKFRLKTRYINIQDWILSKDSNFEFEYGIVYQFVDNSLQKIERIKNKE